MSEGVKDTSHETKDKAKNKQTITKQSENKEGWTTKVISGLAMISVTLSGVINDTVLIPIIFCFLVTLILRNSEENKITKRYADMNEVFVLSYGVVYAINQWLPFKEGLDILFDGVKKGIEKKHIQDLILLGGTWLLSVLAVFMFGMWLLIYFSKKHREDSHWHKVPSGKDTKNTKNDIEVKAEITTEGNTEAKVETKAIGKAEASAEVKVQGKAEVKVISNVEADK